MLVVVGIYGVNEGVEGLVRLGGRYSAHELPKLGLIEDAVGIVVKGAELAKKLEREIFRGL